MPRYDTYHGILETIRYVSRYFIQNCSGKEKIGYYLEYHVDGVTGVFAYNLSFKKTLAIRFYLFIHYNIKELVHKLKYALLKKRKQTRTDIFSSLFNTPVASIANQNIYLYYYIIFILLFHTAKQNDAGTPFMFLLMIPVIQKEFFFPRL